MTIYNQPNLTGGIDDALVSTAQEVMAFPVMILVFVFGVIFLGGSANQKKRIGNADYPFWAVLSGLATTMVALIFSLTSGMIDKTTLGIVIAITSLSGVWFFMSKVRGEQ